MTQFGWQGEFAFRFHSVIFLKGEGRFQLRLVYPVQEDYMRFSFAGRGPVCVGVEGAPVSNARVVVNEIYLTVRGV